MTTRPANPLAPYLALAGVWLLTVTIVPPRGNFPLNDDWIYAKIVSQLVETGEYQSNPYGDPTFIAQAYWGAAFVKVFGFSFDTLRLSTLVLALVAAWGTCWCAREAGLSRPWAFFCALTLIVNPLFVNLSYTFMTDIPFLALSTLAAGAYLRALRTGRVGWIVAGSSIAGIAFLVRQFALVVPVAFVLLLPLTPKNDARTTALRWAAVSIALVVVLILDSFLPVGGPGFAQGWDWIRLGDTFGQRSIEIGRHFAYAFAYLSVFLLPFIVAAVWGGMIGLRKQRVIDWASLRVSLASYVATAVLMAWFIVREWPYRLPNLGNLLYDFGIGPLLLPGMIEGAAIAAPVRFGASFWWCVTALAIAGGAALAMLHAWTLFRIARKPRNRGDLDVVIPHFLALWAFGMLLVLILPPVLARFDRYFVMAQVPASILAARWLAARMPRPAVAGYVAAALSWVFAVIGQQDYLAWNQARWTAIGALRTEVKAPLEEINAGYEPNGWYHSDRFVEESRATGRKVFGPLGWWTVGETYRVSLRPNRGYEVIGTVPYFTWLGFTEREMLLLKRVPIEDQ